MLEESGCPHHLLHFYPPSLDFTQIADNRGEKYEIIPESLGWLNGPHDSPQIPSPTCTPALPLSP